MQPQARSVRNDERKGRSLETAFVLIERSEFGKFRMFGVPLELAEAE